MSLLLTSLGAVGVGVLALVYGIRWVRENGWAESQGEEQSGFLAGLGAVVFGLLAVAGSVKVALEVTPRLWLVGLAMVALAPALRAVVRAMPMFSVRVALEGVDKLLREGVEPSSMTDGWNGCWAESAAHSIIRAALRIPRPPGERAAANDPCRAPAGEPDRAYLDQVAAAIERARRSALAPVTKGVAVTTLTFMITLGFLLDPTPLETLGWGVLGGACAVAVAGLGVGLCLRAQTARVGREIHGLLARGHRVEAGAQSVGP